MDPEAFVRAHTAVATAPLVPELTLHLATEVTPLWEATEVELRRAGLDPPFWAFAWPGSQALARWVLDHPAEFAGKRVLDVGSGGGLAAIAVARVGGVGIANDVDPFAAAATRANAALNGVAVETITGDLAGEDVAADVVLAGDVCYSRTMAERLIAWLRGLARTRRVLLADPGRAFVPREGIRPLATFTVPTTMDLESRTERETTIAELLAG
ncbi:MAG: class I SAM-dependent methyltransferase [Myxococcota bacterium]